MGIGNFFRHPLQTIGDAMYQQVPTYGYPTIDEPLSVDTPDGSQIDLSGQVPLDPAGRPQQIGTTRTGQKTALGRLLTEVAPRALEAGMAGIATPNIAGGGALDFARAFQAGGHALRQRDIDAFRMAQMRQASAAKAAEDAAHRDELLAHADYYRHQADQQPKPERKTYTLPPGAVMVDETGSVLYTNPTKDNSKPIIVPQGSTVLDSEGSPIYTAPKPAAPEKPEKPTFFKDGNGNITAVEHKDGQYVQTPVGKIAAATPQRKAAGGPTGPKPLNPSMQAAGRFLAAAGGDAVKARALATQAAQTDPGVAAQLQPILKGIDSAREHPQKQDPLQKLRGLFGSPAGGPTQGQQADPLGIR
jgi:hypothetical protein